MDVDASGYALGGVLSQLQDDKWRSIAFISHTMTDAGLNYDIYDKELLAIMYEYSMWRVSMDRRKGQRDNQGKVRW